jgi:hypothetical protein
MEFERQGGKRRGGGCLADDKSDSTGGYTPRNKHAGEGLWVAVALRNKLWKNILLGGVGPSCDLGLWVTKPLGTPG